MGDLTLLLATQIVLIHWGGCHSGRVSLRYLFLDHVLIFSATQDMTDMRLHLDTIQSLDVMLANVTLIVESSSIDPDFWMHHALTSDSTHR